MMHPITLILAETALETIPMSISTHPSVQASARKKKRPIDQILLDSSNHHHAMKSLPDHSKRGRPDIAHICLLLATASPLYHKNMLNIIIHTRNDKLIIVNPSLQWRPPKNYTRFCGLIEQLFASKNKHVPDTNTPLLFLKARTLKHTLEQLDRPIILFTEKGEYSQLSRQIPGLIKDSEQKTLTILIGAFPHGDFSHDFLEMVDHRFSISKMPLEACIVVSRVVYEIEKCILS